MNELKFEVIRLFALPGELREIFEGLEGGKKAGLTYWLQKWYGEGEEPRQWSSVLEMPSFGYSESGDTNTDSRYLLLPRGVEITKRPIPTGYEISFRSNYEGLHVLPGGLHDEAAIIPTEIARVIGYRGFSDICVKQIKRHISNWSKKGLFKISPGAQGAYADNLRLTSSVRSPREFDLRLD